MKKICVSLVINLIFMCFVGCNNINNNNNAIQINEKNIEANIDENNNKQNTNSFSGYDVSCTSFNKENEQLLKNIDGAKAFDYNVGLQQENEITFGTYNNGTENMPLKWIVLDKIDGKVLLIQKDHNITMRGYNEIIQDYYIDVANDENHKYHELYTTFKKVEKLKDEKYKQHIETDSSYDDFLNSKEYKEYAKLFNKIAYTEFFMYIEDKMKDGDMIFSDTEQNLICDTTIYTRKRDIGQDIDTLPITSKYFVLSSDDYEKYFGVCDEEYKNENASLISNTMLRDIGFDTTYGIGRMFVNDEGFLDMDGISPAFMKYKNSYYNLKPCIFVQYEENDKNTLLYSNEKFKRILDKKYLKEKIESVKPINTLKNKNVKENDKINFGGFEWYLLKKDNNKALLMMSDIYVNKVFEKKYKTSKKNKKQSNRYDGNWETSLLRKYLNTQFFDEFTDEEKAIIISQTLYTYKNKDISSLSLGPDIPHHEKDDKVFLLSPYEVCAYFGDRVNSDLTNIKLQGFSNVNYINNVNMMFLRDYYITSTPPIKTYSGVNANNEFVKMNKKEVAGLRPCIVINYDEKYEKVIDEYNDVDKKIDTKLIIYNVKEELKKEMGGKATNTFHYVGEPSSYYDNEFIYNEYIAFYEKDKYEDEEIEDYKYVRSLYSDILGRCDIVINAKTKKYYYRRNITDSFPQYLVKQYNEKYQNDSNSTTEYMDRMLESYIDPLEKKKAIKTLGNDTDKLNAEKGKVQTTYQVKDKVTFGNIDGLPLIWTVVAINNDNTIKICSDYTFDFETKLDIWEEEKERTFNSFFSGDELDVIFEHNADRYEYLDYETYKNIFEDKNSRRSLGCLNNTFRGYKAYKVGGNGKYKNSTNAIDADGEYYFAYDYKILPRKICINVDEESIKLADKNYKIYNFLDTYDMAKDEYGKDYIFLENIYDKHLCEYEDELVEIDGTLKYVDYGGIEKEIIELNNNTKNNLNIGDIVSFGKYVDYKNGKKNDDIKMLYRVQNIEGSELNLDSVYSINTQSDEDKDTSYEKSKIRFWLNNTFYNTSFTNNEKTMIKFKEIVLNKGYDDEKSFYDYVYLVSSEEDVISKYMIMNAVGLLRKEESILSAKCIVDEYENLSKENYSEILKKDRYIKLMSSFDGIYKSNYVGTRLDFGEKIYILPSLTVDLDEENKLGTTIPYNIYTRLDKCIMKDNNLYYIDCKHNLNVIKDYNSDKKYKNEDIIKLGENVAYLYYRNEHILFLSHKVLDLYSSVDYLYEVYNVDNVKQIDKNVYHIIIFKNDEITYFVNARRDDNYKIDGKKKNYNLTITELYSKDSIEENIDATIKTETNNLTNEIFSEYDIALGEDNFIEIDDDMIDDDEIFLDSLNADKYIIYRNYYDLNIMGDEWYATLVDKKNFYLYGVYGRSLKNGIFLAYRGSGYINIDQLYIKNDKLYKKTLDKYKGEYSFLDYDDGVLYYERYEGGQGAKDKSIFRLKINSKPSKIIYERNFEESWFFDYKNDTIYLIDEKNDLHKVTKDINETLLNNVDGFGKIDDKTLYVAYKNDNKKKYLYDMTTKEIKFIGEGDIFIGIDKTIQLVNDAKPGETENLFQNPHKMVLNGVIYDLDDAKYGSMTIRKVENVIYATTIDKLYKLEIENDSIKYNLILNDIYNLFPYDIAISGKYIAYKKKDDSDKISIYLTDGNTEKMIKTYDKDINLVFCSVKNSIYLQEFDKDSYYKYNLIDLINDKIVMDDQMYNINEFICEVYK